MGAKRISPFLIIQLGISGGALFFVLRRLGGAAALAEAFSGLSFVWVAACFLAAFAAHAVAVLRWQILGNAALSSSRPFLFYVRFYLIGLFYATFVPGGQVVGEGVKMARMIPDRSSRSALIASIVADRIIGLAANGAMLVVLFFGSAYVRSSPFSGVGFFSGAAIITASAALAALMLFFRRGDTMIRTPPPSGAWRYVAFMRSAIGTSAEHFSKKKAALTASFIGAFAFHTAAGLILYLTIRAYGFHADFFFSVWVYLVLSIALVFPISYAGFGIREGVFAHLLAFAGVFAEKALLISLFFFAVQAVFALIGGMFDFIEIRRALRRS